LLIGAVDNSICLFFFVCLLFQALLLTLKANEFEIHFGSWLEGVAFLARVGIEFLFVMTTPMSRI
jgi:hypothetical protein